MTYEIEVPCPNCGKKHTLKGRVTSGSDMDVYIKPEKEPECECGAILVVGGWWVQIVEEEEHPPKGAVGGERDEKI